MAAEEFRYTTDLSALVEQYPVLRPMIKAIGTFLEDRDRELEAWLAEFGRNAVSVNAPEFTDGWTPAPHHTTHEPGGSDEIPVIAGPPGVDGADGAPGADADPMLAAVLATPPRGLKGDAGPTGADGDPVIAGLFAHGPRGQKGDKGDTGLTGSAGADADEGLVWSRTSP